MLVRRNVFRIIYFSELKSTVYIVLIRRFKNQYDNELWDFVTTLFKHILYLEHIQKMSFLKIDSAMGFS